MPVLGPVIEKAMQDNEAPVIDRLSHELIPSSKVLGDVHQNDLQKMVAKMVKIEKGKGPRKSAQEVLDWFPEFDLPEEHQKLAPEDYRDKTDAYWKERWDYREAKYRGRMQKLTKCECLAVIDAVLQRHRNDPDPDGLEALKEGITRYFQEELSLRLPCAMMSYFAALEGEQGVQPEPGGSPSGSSEGQFSAKSSDDGGSEGLGFERPRAEGGLKRPRQEGLASATFELTRSMGLPSGGSGGAGLAGLPVEGLGAPTASGFERLLGSRFAGPLSSGLEGLSGSGVEEGPPGSEGLPGSGLKGLPGSVWKGLPGSGLEEGHPGSRFEGLPGSGLGAPPASEFKGPPGSGSERLPWDMELEAARDGPELGLDDFEPESTGGSDTQEASDEMDVVDKWILCPENEAGANEDEAGGGGGGDESEQETVVVERGQGEAEGGGQSDEERKEEEEEEDEDEDRDDMDSDGGEDDDDRKPPPGGAGNGAADRRGRDGGSGDGDRDGGKGGGSSSFENGDTGSWFLPEWDAGCGLRRGVYVPLRVADVSGARNPQPVAAGGQEMQLSRAAVADVSDVPAGSPLHSVAWEVQAPPPPAPLMPDDDEGSSEPRPGLGLQGWVGGAFKKSTTNPRSETSAATALEVSGAELGGGTSDRPEEGPVADTAKAVDIAQMGIANLDLNSTVLPDVPAKYMCPITGGDMVDSVFLFSSGQSDERATTEHRLSFLDGARRESESDSSGLAAEDASSTVSVHVTKDPDVMTALSNLLLDGGLNAKVAIGAEQLTDLLQAHPQKWMQVYEAEAVEPLVRVLGFKGQVRLFAVTALEAIMAAAVREAYGNNNKVAENACGEIIEKARDSLLELLSDESLAIRGKAAETIGHCLEVRTISVLLAKQEKTGLITGLVHLSFAEGLHEMMHGVHGPATVESVRSIGRRVLCQLARVVVTNQAQSAKLAADPAPEDVVDSLWKLVLDRATTIEALEMLTWLAQGAPSGLSEQSVVEGAGARERKAVLTYLLGQAESNKPLRLPLAKFLAGLAATASEPGDLLGTAGVDKLLRLLQALVKEIGDEPGAAEGWACVSLVVDFLATTSSGEGEDETQEGSADVKRRELSVTTLLELLRLATKESVPRARFSDLSPSLQNSIQSSQSSALRCVGVLSVSRPFARRFVEEGGVELISMVFQAVRSRTRDCAEALAGLMVACPVKTEAALKNSAALLGLCKMLDGGNGEERLAALHVLDLVVSTGSVAQNLEPTWLCPEGEESANCRTAGAELFAKLSSTNGWGDRGTSAIGAALGFLTDAQKRGLMGGPAVQSVLQALKALTTNPRLCAALTGDKQGVNVLVQVAKQLKTPTAQIMTQISECVPETAAADSRFVAALVSLLDDPDAQSSAAAALDKLASGAAHLGNVAGAGNAHVAVLLKAVPLAKVEDKIMLVRVLWRLCKGIGAAVIETVLSGGGLKILLTAAKTLEASGRTGDAVACLVAITSLKVAATDLGRDIVAASATAFLVKLLEASVKGSREDRVRYAVFFLGCAARVDPDACMHAGIIPALELHLADAKKKDECTLAGIEVIAALLSGASGETARDALVKTNAAAHCAALARAGKRCPGKAQNVSCGGECIAEATIVTKELARSRSSKKSSWRGILG
ncbi:Armadillo-like helical [Klebsormidium nitens]|uniref:Armadillo-like helical n=1 Tax=Klebsormidium nitens TaxID=105231 RepID=A0A1Y1ISL6_KLENI|nr:Armadillo-like helical [Klebsormidium nitens]|eukprot:GAQ91647.1 Armadillo-like helical [Klebsormidium nitens]